MSKKRISPTTIFIACEGRNTEPLYFERIAEQVEDDGLLAITIYPDKDTPNPKTDALNLIREAQSKGDEFDEVWVVFDKDGYTKHKEAFELAAKGGREVKIAFSSIAFEHWALLHFTKCDTAFSKSDCKDDKEHVLFCGTGQNDNDCHGERCVAGYMRAHNFCKDYAKSGSYSFNHLDKKEIAFKNAAWLRYKMRHNLNEENTEIYHINPYTDVDILVKRLFSIHTNYIWIGLNETVETDNFSIHVEKLEDSFNIQLSNKSKQTFVFNQTNYQNHFQTLTTKGVQINLALESTITIEPNTMKLVRLTPKEFGGVLVFKKEQDEIFIELND
jgi:urease beta subunit